MTSDVQIFKAPDAAVELTVKLDNDTVWLTQKQMAELFEKGRTTITEHIRNIFREGELEEEVVCRKSRHTTQHGAIKGKTQQKTLTYYNLDVIISVGYRVKSQRGVQFRQWATQRLKDYLVQGYAINEKRLEQKQQEVRQLKTGIQILSRAFEEKAATDGFEWLHQYSKGLELLDDYDHEQLDAKGLSTELAVFPEMEEYQQLIDEMKAEFDSSVFGKEKDKGFQGSIAQISKGFGEEDFYPSLEEKAATLLYLIIKNHSFVDGNKRIAAACFLLFLERNKLLSTETGLLILSNEALASLTLFVAASKPDEMETVKKLIISILNRNKTT